MNKAWVLILGFLTGSIIVIPILIVAIGSLITALRRWYR